MSKTLWKTPIFEDVFCAFRDTAEALGPRAAVRLLLDMAELPALEIVAGLEDAQAEEVAAAQEWSRAHELPKDARQRAADLAAQAVAVLEIGGGSEDPPPDPRALALLRSAAGLLTLQADQARAEEAR